MYIDIRANAARVKSQSYCSCLYIIQRSRLGFRFDRTTYGEFLEERRSIEERPDVLVLSKRR